MDGGKKLGVEPVLEAADMARPDVEYLGPMAYLTYFQWVRPRQNPNEAIQVRCETDTVRVNNPVSLLDIRLICEKLALEKAVMNVVFSERKFFLIIILCVVKMDWICLLLYKLSKI